MGEEEESAASNEGSVKSESTSAESKLSRESKESNDDEDPVPQGKFPISYPFFPRSHCGTMSFWSVVAGRDASVLLFYHIHLFQ